MNLRNSALAKIKEITAQTDSLQALKQLNDLYADVKKSQDVADILTQISNQVGILVAKQNEKFNYYWKRKYSSCQEIYTETLQFVEAIALKSISKPEVLQNLAELFFKLACYKMHCLREYDCETYLLKTLEYFKGEDLAATYNQLAFLFYKKSTINPAKNSAEIRITQDYARLALGQYLICQSTNNAIPAFAYNVLGESIYLFDKVKGLEFLYRALEGYGKISEYQEMRGELGRNIALKQFQDMKNPKEAERLLDLYDAMTSIASPRLFKPSSPKNSSMRQGQKSEVEANIVDPAIIGSTSSKFTPGGPY